MKHGQYDPRWRDAQKQRCRDRDAADLASGHISVRALQDQNRFLKGADPHAAKIRRWKVFA
jgi:hypothetical protein